MLILDSYPMDSDIIKRVLLATLLITIIYILKG